MAGAAKRSREDAPRTKVVRPSKKQKQSALEAYHSGSESAESDEEHDFNAVNLLDSDAEDLDNLEVDDGASSGAESASDSDNEARAPREPRQPLDSQKFLFAQDAPDTESESDSAADSDDGGEEGQRRKRSKRNDPTAFATSLSKILSTKLSTARRADPVLARSADAQKASRQAVDSALENKAKRRLREAKRLAMEKGRVKDVLVATSGTPKLNVLTGEVEMEEDADGKNKDGETTGQILATERRLRKVAQRGVVKLFNAVRASQVKATEAERTARNEGVVGVKRREEKVTEMSRKGFLDLIASGGGNLKKGAIEEA